jgi:hypothetical protein
MDLKTELMHKYKKHLMTSKQKPSEEKKIEENKSQEN